MIDPEPASYSEATELIDRMRAGEIQALLVHGANPGYDLPPKSGFMAALENVPFVASFAPVVDETAAWADLILPDRTFLEGWGYALASPGFEQPVVGSQQPVVTPVFDSRSSADILLTVSRGIPAAAKALPFADEVEFLKGLVSQLGPGSAGGQEPDELWARFQQHGGWWTAGPLTAEPLQAPSSAPAVQPVVPVYTGEIGEYPYHLCLYPSCLLSDGRGANQKWLQGSPDPMTTVSWQTWVELHPETAHEIGVQDGDIVQVSSPEGQIEAPVYVYPAIRPDTVGIPLGQGHTDYGRFARGRGSNGLELVGTQTDATGSSLAWAGLRVKISPTGKKVPLALFEFKSGVIEANLREELPGWN